MEWGSEDMTETDDSENQLSVESYNYDLSEGMTPMTYTPPPPFGGTGAGGMRFEKKKRSNWMSPFRLIVIG